MVEVAPEMGLNVVPPSVLICHCTLGAGLPAATAVKLAVPPASTAWAVGFVVGILPFLPLPPDVKRYVQPAALYSFIAGFVVYALLAKAGLEPKVVDMAAK